MTAPALSGCVFADNVGGDRSIHLEHVVYPGIVYETAQVERHRLHGVSGDGCCEEETHGVVVCVHNIDWEVDRLSDRTALA